MTILFRSLSLNDPPLWSPRELAQVAQKHNADDSDNELADTSSLADYPPKSIDQLIEIIRMGKAQELSFLEWIYCVQNKAQWDKEHPSEAISVSRMIWEAAKNDARLRRFLLWHVCNFPSHRESVAESIISTFSEFSRQSNAPLAIRIVRHLLQDQYNEIASLACKHLLVPKKLFAKADLPTFIPAVQKTLDHAVRKILPQPRGEEQVIWFLKCAELMLPEQRKNAIDYLLTGMKKEEGTRYKRLVEWLRERFGPRTQGSEWLSLSTEARQELRRWIGDVTYKEFESLVNLLLDDQQYRDNLTDLEKRQLQSRSTFWSHYSERFEGLRILLPKTAMKIVGNASKETNVKQMEQLEEDGSHPTEVCIFDLHNILVVEFFHGQGGETRFFPSDRFHRKWLFGKPTLSIKKIRSLGGIRHDHAFLWQVYCERMLRSNGTLPNPGIREFKGIPKRASHYSFLTGLSDPSLEDEELRDLQVKRWEKKIEKLEWDASKLVLSELKNHFGPLSESVVSGLLEQKLMETTN